MSPTFGRVLSHKYKWVVVSDGESHYWGGVCCQYQLSGTCHHTLRLEFCPFKDTLFCPYLTFSVSKPTVNKHLKLMNSKFLRN